MTARRVVPFLIPLIVLAHAGLRVQAAPNLVSVFPLGAQRGTVLDVEIQGSGLDGSYAAWLGAGSRLETPKTSASPAEAKCAKCTDGLEAHVRAVQGGARATVRLVIAPDARVGFHTLSLVSA